MPEENALRERAEVTPDVKVVALADLRILFLQTVTQIFNRTLMDKEIAFRAEVEHIRDTQYAGGVRYATLRDGDVTISAMLSADHARLLSEGDAGIFRGVFQINNRSEQSTKFDSLLFRVSHFEREGLGEAFELKVKLREQLEAEGILHRQAKQFPAMRPSGLDICIVSNQRAKGYSDIVTALRNTSHAKVRLQACNLMNETEVAEAIENADRLNMDIIIIARGGGEGLGVFDSERVVRSIAKCRTFTIAAVGHADDSTLANEVADFAVITPTGAATFILDRIREYEITLERKQIEEQRKVEREEAEKRFREIFDTHQKQLETLAKNHKEQVETLTKQLEVNQAQVKQLLQDLQSKSEESKSLSQQIEQLKKNSSANPEEHTKMLQELTRQLGEMHSSQEALRNQLTQLQASNGVLTKRLTELQSSNEQLGKQISHLQTANANLEKRKQELERALEAAKQTHTKEQKVAINTPRIPKITWVLGFIAVVCAIGWLASR